MPFTPLETETIVEALGYLIDILPLIRKEGDSHDEFAQELSRIERLQTKVLTPVDRIYCGWDRSSVREALINSVCEPPLGADRIQQLSQDEAFLDAVLQTFRGKSDLNLGYTWDDMRDSIGLELRDRGVLVSISANEDY